MFQVTSDVAFVENLTKTTLRYGDTESTNAANQKISNAHIVINIFDRNTTLKCTSGIYTQKGPTNSMNSTKAGSRATGNLHLRNRMSSSSCLSPYVPSVFICLENRRRYAIIFYGQSTTRVKTSVHEYFLTIFLYTARRTHAYRHHYLYVVIICLSIKSENFKTIWGYLVFGTNIAFAWVNLYRVITV